MLLKGFFLIAFCVFSVCQSEKCKSVKPFNHFDATKVVGKWYEIEKYNNQISTAMCSVLVNDQIKGNSYHFDLKHKEPKTMEEKVLSGNVFLSNPTDGDGILRAVFTNGAELVLKVIDTDYDNYVALYGCDDSKGEKQDIFWVFSRNTSLSPDADSRIKNIMKENEIQVIKTQQTCKFY